MSDIYLTTEQEIECKDRAVVLCQAKLLETQDVAESYRKHLATLRDERESLLADQRKEFRNR